MTRLRARLRVSQMNSGCGLSRGTRARSSRLKPHAQMNQRGGRVCVIESEVSDMVTRAKSIAQDAAVRTIDNTCETTLVCSEIGYS